MPAIILTHKNTEDKYEATRHNARHIAQESLPLVMTNSVGKCINLRSDVALTGIDFKAKIQANHWHQSAFRQVDWPWMKAVGNYAWRNPKRFELAIWYREHYLSGLALGRPTWSGNKLRLDFIEASPEKHELTGLIVDIVLVAAEVYADAIGARQLRIMHPINEKVKNYYLREDRGFSYNQKENYCYKDLL